MRRRRSARGSAWKSQRAPARYTLPSEVTSPGDRTGTNPVSRMTDIPFSPAASRSGTSWARTFEPSSCAYFDVIQPRSASDRTGFGFGFRKESPSKNHLPSFDTNTTASAFNVS